jgi:C-terminal processing protease CtpA/Prc
VVERIRGEEGSSVLLEIERPGQGRFTVQVNRGQVVVKDPPEGTPPGHP